MKSFNCFSLSQASCSCYFIQEMSGEFTNISCSAYDLMGCSNSLIMLFWDWDLAVDLPNLVVSPDDLTFDDVLFVFKGLFFFFLSDLLKFLFSSLLLSLFWILIWSSSCSFIISFWLFTESCLICCCICLSWVNAIFLFFYSYSSLLSSSDSYEFLISSSLSIIFEISFWSEFIC